MLNLVASNKAEDIGLFYDNLLKTENFKKLIEEYGTEEKLFSAIKTTHTTIYYDASGKACFTPSGVASYFYFAKKNCEHELEFEVRNEIGKLLVDLNPQNFILDVMQIEKKFDSRRFYTFDLLLDALELSLSSYIRNWKIQDEEEEKAHPAKGLFDTLLQSENPSIVFALMSRYGVYECVIDLYVSKKIKDKKERTKLFEKEIFKMGLEEKWLELLKKAKELYTL